MRAIACAIIAFYLLDLAKTMGNSVGYQLASYADIKAGLVLVASYLFLATAVVLMFFGL